MTMPQEADTPSNVLDRLKEAYTFWTNHCSGNFVLFTDAINEIERLERELSEAKKALNYIVNRTNDELARIEAQEALEKLK